MTRTIGLLVRTLCLTSVLVALDPRPALADDNSGAIVAGAIAIGSSVPFMIGGFTTGVGNFYYCEKDRAPGRGWIIAGYVMGSINVVGGSLLSGFSRHYALGLSLGIAQAIIGAGGIGFAIWGHRLALRDERMKKKKVAGLDRLMLTPLVAPHGGGGIVVGISVNALAY